jgi:hypothetical protein
MADADLHLREIEGFLREIEDELVVIRKATLAAALFESGEDRDRSIARGLLAEIRPRER